MQVEVSDSVKARKDPTNMAWKWKPHSTCVRELVPERSPSVDGSLVEAYGSKLRQQQSCWVILEGCRSRWERAAYFETTQAGFSLFSAPLLSVVLSFWISLHPSAALLSVLPLSVSPIPCRCNHAADGADKAALLV